MSKFEVYEDSVQYRDADGDVLELVYGSDDGVLLTSGQDGTWVDSKDLAEVVKHMAHLSGVDGEFIEATGHEVETLWESYGCGVGESLALVNRNIAKAEVVEERARNLWAIAKVMRAEEDRKAEEEEEEKNALPEVGTYVALRRGTVTTYGFPVILDEDTNIFVVAASPECRKVSVSGTASGKRRVYTVRPEAVTAIRPKVAVGDRVAVAANATTYTEEATHFVGETTGIITAIHEFDATVRGYCHASKAFIEQQVAFDFLTPAEEPKVGDRVHVHRYAQTTDGSRVYFDQPVEGIVEAVHSSGLFAGDLSIETKDPRATYRKQYVAPQWVVVLEKAEDIEAARAEVLRLGSVKFGDLPEELQKFVDDEIERKKK